MQISRSKRILLIILTSLMLLFSFFTIFNNVKKTHADTQVAKQITFYSGNDIVYAPYGSLWQYRFFDFVFSYPYLDGTAYLITDFIANSTGVADRFDVLVNYDYVDLTDPSYPTITEEERYTNVTNVNLPFFYDSSNITLYYYITGVFANDPNLVNSNYVFKVDVLGSIPDFIDTENNYLETVTYSSDNTFNKITYLTGNSCGLEFSFLREDGGQRYMSYTYFLQNVDQYQQGYRDGEKQGTSIGYQQGYDKGYNQGVADSGDYSFFGLMTAVVDAPIQALSGLLNFEIFDVKLDSFFFSILTLALLISFIRLVL